ncbi:MAG: AAA family ATPase, partial [Actinomycetota bacterium]|nr:AAA family ATPase [Actinomycetota bacterium]
LALSVKEQTLTVKECLRVTDGRLIPAGAEELRYSTTEMLAVERDVIARATEPDRQARGVARPQALDAALMRRPSLFDDQREMVHRLATSGAAIDVVVGKAGAGKTFALDAAREAWESSGLRVIGCSLAARAAEELELGSGIRSHTIRRLLRDLDDPRNGALPQGSVLVVDEAAMVGTRDLARLMSHAGAAGAKVVLVGDDRQLPSIDAGGAFRAIKDRISSIELNEVRRQPDGWERDALDLVRLGHAQPAIDAYVGHGRVVMSTSAEDTRKRLIGDWWVSCDDDEPAVMLAARRSDVFDLNARARSVMRAAGRLGDVDFNIGGVVGTITSWVSNGAQWLLSRVVSFLDQSTSPTLGASWFADRYHFMVGLAALVLLPLLLIATIRAIVNQDSGQLVRSYFVHLPVAILTTFVAVFFTRSFLSLTDAMSSTVAHGIAGNVSQIFDEVKRGLGGAATTGAPSFAIFFGALFIIIGSFFVWLELLVRSAAVTVSVFFLPLVLTGLVWPATARWTRRLVETLVALILSKFVIVAVISLATAALADPGCGGFGAVMGGAALMLMAAFSPMALLKLMPIAEGAAIGHLEGTGRNRLTRWARREVSTMPCRSCAPRPGEGHRSRDPTPLPPPRFPVFKGSHRRNVRVATGQTQGLDKLRATLDCLPRRTTNHPQANESMTSLANPSSHQPNVPDGGHAPVSLRPA